MKEFIPFEKAKKESDRHESPRQKSKGRQKEDREVQVIHVGYSSRVDTITAQNEYIKNTKVVAIEVTNRKPLDCYSGF